MENQTLIGRHEIRPSAARLLLKLWSFSNLTNKPTSKKFKRKSMSATKDAICYGFIAQDTLDACKSLKIYLNEALSE